MWIRAEDSRHYTEVSRRVSPRLASRTHVGKTKQKENKDVHRIVAGTNGDCSVDGFLKTTCTVTQICRG